MKRMRRLLIASVATVTAVFLACTGLFAAWLSGAHIPLASGATWLRVEKIAPVSANRVGGGPTAPLFILLVGNDSRPGVGGARGDALHVLGVNPATHQATMLDIPRDTCWHGDKINVGNTKSPRAQADDVSGLLGGVPISYVVDVDFAGFTGLVDGVGGVDVNVPMKMHDTYSGAYFDPGLHHMTGDQALSFSRDRHDFPTSDLVRSQNQGLLILDAMRQLRKQMQSAPGEFKLLALLGQHAQLDGIGIKDLYRLGRTAFAINPDQVKNIRIPINGGSCLTLGAGAQQLFADFRDDGVVQTAG